MRIGRYSVPALASAAALLLAIIATSLAPASRVIAQQWGDSTPLLRDARPIGMTKEGQLLSVGERCQRRTDGQMGQIRRDACARWYCGREDTPDIIEAIPDWGERHGCTWQLKGDSCRCLRPDGSPRSVHRAK